VKKRFSIIMILVIAVLSLSSSVFAWSPYLEGRPDAFRPGDSRGYFIWQDEDGLHLKTTTRGREHVFSGVIRTDGRFVDVEKNRLENGDFYRVSNDRDTITFRFTTTGGSDGIDFRIRNGERINFDLFVDGHNVKPHEIYLGNRGWHPKHNDFTIYNKI